MQKRNYTFEEIHYSHEKFENMMKYPNTEGMNNEKLVKRAGCAISVNEFVQK